MFQYSEEFDFSLDLVKKCGEVIKKAFYSEKKIRSDTCQFWRFITFTFKKYHFSARRAPPTTL